MAVRVHVGCGSQPLAGWINVDRDDLPGVDRVLDVRRGLPFAGVELIFAEHFLEHLTLGEGLAFLAECRRVLRPDGVLRISTPNLDWVYLTHYAVGRERAEEITACLELNRAFHGWGHRFLYNRSTLAAALGTAGFARTDFRAYGDSDLPQLRGLERHARDPDLPGHPHVLVAEAAGEGSPAEDLRRRAADYLRDLAIGSPP